MVEDDDSHSSKDVQSESELEDDEPAIPSKTKAMPGMESDSDDDSQSLEVEEEARRIDQETKITEEEADEELQETIEKHTEAYHLPTVDELQKDAGRVVSVSETQAHIDSILRTLSDFSKLREAGRSRKEYLDVLSYLLAEQNGYLPELVDYFMTMFSPAELVEFISASDKPRPLVIRTNTLMTRRKDLAAALIKRGITLDPVASWSKVGLKIIESPVPVGATPEYLTGMYMLQSAASMCPVLALAPQPKERILDMSSAPGGKTSYIAQLMRNTGCLIANDLKPERQKATVANLHRLGVSNVITCTHDGRKLGAMFQQHKFDRILLDAPCSGLGVISRDPSVKVQRTIADVLQTAHLQKELLLSAIDCLKCTHSSENQKVLVYSTCSVSVAENEQVVNYALEKRDVKLVETSLDFGEAGYTRYQQYRFHPSLALTRRFYPHIHNMDGFFVAKFVKLSDKKIKGAKEKQTSAGEPKESKVNSNYKHIAAKDKQAGKSKEAEQKKRKISVPPKKVRKAKKEKN